MAVLLLLVVCQAWLGPFPLCQAAACCLPPTPTSTDLQQAQNILGQNVNAARPGPD